MAACNTKCNESRNTYTLPPYMDPRLLQCGWQMMLSTEGDIYYQNNITKKTQWTPPVLDPSENSESDRVPFITEMANIPSHPRATQITAASALQPNINTEPQRIRKICDKQHFIWIFGMAWSIWDIITDIQVAIVWRNLPSLCSQFTCYTPNQIERWACNSSILLLVCSSLGFLIGTVLKWLELKLLYASYKTILTEEELTEKQHQIWKLNVKYNWIPLVIEDVVSIVLLELVLSTALLEIVLFNPTLCIIHLRSLCTSLLGIVFTLLNTYRKKRELVKHKLFPRGISCYCCWCYCLGCCFMPPVVYLLLSDILLITSVHKWAYVDIVDYTNYTSSPYTKNLSQFSCGLYAPAIGQPALTSTDMLSAADIFGNDRLPFIGKIKQPPAFLYPNCSGHFYDYDLICRGHAINLQCTLTWEYMADVGDGTAQNMSDDIDCYKYDEDLCRFHIDLGVCEDYTIECDNDWEFFKGNPLMWACFQQCTLD
eukprot:118057_1